MSIFIAWLPADKSIFATCQARAVLTNAGQANAATVGHQISFYVIFMWALSNN